MAREYDLDRPSGNWASFPVEVTQPDSAGWRITHAYRYGFREGTANVLVSTYDLTSWPNAHPGDGLHVPHGGVEVELSAGGVIVSATTWPDGPHNKDGAGFELAAGQTGAVKVADGQPTGSVGGLDSAPDTMWRVYFTYVEEDNMMQIPQPAGWQIPDWNEAEWVKTTIPLAGETRYVLVDARVIDNPGDHTLYIEVMTEDDERDTEAVVSFQNADGTTTTKQAEKPLDEPMCNVPLYKDDTYRVWVGGLSESDQVTKLHTRYEDHPELGTTWGHIPYLLQFKRVIGDEVGPEPNETLEQFIRRKTWDKSGTDWNPDAAFPKYAASKGLGKPETQEFDLEFGGKMYRVQGFTLGIVFCLVGDWANVRSLKW